MTIGLAIRCNMCGKKIASTYEGKWWINNLDDTVVHDECIPLLAAKYDSVNYTDPPKKVKEVKHVKRT